MNTFRSSNIHTDIMRFLKKEDEALAHLPVCSVCGQPIQQEDAVHFGDSMGWVCDDCLSLMRETID